MDKAQFFFFLLGFPKTKKTPPLGPLPPVSVRNDAEYKNRGIKKCEQKILWLVGVTHFYEERKGECR